MTTPTHPCPASDGNRFTFNEFTADPYTAGHVRNEFAAWLGRRVQLSAIRFSDVVLAVNEALANATEFAYLKNNGVGVGKINQQPEMFTGKPLAITGIVLGAIGTVLGVGMFALGMGNALMERLNP